MGDAIGSGSVTDCCLRSFCDHRQHTQQCRAAPRQKSLTSLNNMIAFKKKQINKQKSKKIGQTNTELSSNQRTYR